jgi:predicted enzyme related to lactoylglutathione lyase
MAAVLCYAIKFVDDMDAAVQFHVARLGLTLRFQSPDWSEFDTGTTTLALHRASAEQPAGTCQLGFRVAELDQFHADATQAGVTVIEAPTRVWGTDIARFRDPDGAEFRVSGA